MLDTLAKWIAQCGANPHIAFYEEDFVDVHQRLAAAGGSDSGIEAEAKELIRIVKSIDKKHVEAVARIRAAAGMQPLQVSSKGASQLGELTGREFADAVRVYKEAFAVLPGEDPRTLDISSRASAPLAAETPNDKQGAVALLSVLQAEASKLATTIGEEHKSAVGLYQEAMKALPPEEARVQILASRAEGPLGATLAKDQASATGILAEYLEQEKNGATVSTTALEYKVREEQMAAADEFRKKLAKMVDAFEKSTNDAMLSELANDLGSPQVLVADTNWGDERTHTFFVAMPDPTTGELRLWRKTEPGGELTPEDRKWVDTLWDKTE